MRRDAWPGPLDGKDSKASTDLLVPRASAADMASEQPPSLAPVLAAVVIASFGALAFGYHLGVVNGPLDAIAAELGFAGNAGLQGLVRSALRTLYTRASSPRFGAAGLLPLGRHSHTPASQATCYAPASLCTAAGCPGQQRMQCPSLTSPLPCARRW